MTDKTKALRLIASVAFQSIQHYKAANGITRTRSDMAADREFNAAKNALKAMTDEPVTDEEIKKALGW